MPFVKETFQIPTPQGVMVFLQQTLRISQREAQKFVDKGRVAQNGEVVRDKKRILRGEVSVSYFRAVDLGIVPIFETPEFAVFDKPAGLLSHPKGRFWHFSLLDAVRFHFGSEANLINRLDCETSGVILASKNKKSEAELKGLFERRAVEKSYLAVCSPPLNLHSIDFANAESSKKIRAKHPKKSFCYFWLLPKVESSFPYRLQSTKKGKFADSTLDSTIPQNLAESSKKSALDSTNSQNLTRKVQNHRISHAKCESALDSASSGGLESLRKGRTLLFAKAKSSKNFLDSAPCAESSLESCVSTQNSPVSWCKKSGIKGAEVPPADFLLETEKRGTPPKSEKAAAFWRVGGEWRGVQPFLRKESGEFGGEGIVDSAKDSAKLRCLVD